MAVYVESDGSRTVPVNAYSNLYRFRFIAPGIVFDAPGEVVFCSEGLTWRGTQLTFIQSRSGMNLYAKSGLVQLLVELGVGRGVWFGQLQKREYEDVDKMYKDFAMMRVLGHLPKEEFEEDERTADLLLLPMADRLAAAVDWEPEKIIFGTLKIIRAFTDLSIFGSYKSQRYRDKLLTLKSAFLPAKKDFHLYEIDMENLFDSAMKLVMMFS